MSAKKQNQHFVPRHYLKRFSFDGGSRIGLFNLARKLCVSGAPLKSQCSSNYFYGKDPTAENLLKALEDVAETTFKKICDHKDIPRSRGEREELLITLALMHHRTERAAGPLNEMMEITLKNVIRKRRGAQGKEVPDWLDRVRIRDRAMPLKNGQSVFGTLPTCARPRTAFGASPDRKDVHHQRPSGCSFEPSVFRHR